MQFHALAVSVDTEGMCSSFTFLLSHKKIIEFQSQVLVGQLHLFQCQINKILSQSICHHTILHLIHHLRLLLFRINLEQKNVVVELLVCHMPKPCLLIFVYSNREGMSSSPVYAAYANRRLSFVNVSSNRLLNVSSSN